MSKMQLVYTGKVRHEKDLKTGREIDVYETTYREKPRPCKQCKTRARKPGSSRCAECIAAHVHNRADNARIRAKIERQVKG